MVKRWLQVLILVIFSLGSSRLVWATDLDEVYIRPDRAQAGVSTGKVLIVAKTGSAETENGVKVEIGPAWDIGNSSSDFTVSTARLPSGVTAWPGIKTATQVNGRQIIFPGNNLTAGKSYGFYITNGINTNPSVGSGSDYYWRISTLVFGNDDRSRQFELRVVENDQITVTGVIAANASDYQAAISSDLIGKAEQNHTVHYEITYGSYSLIRTQPLVITADWSRGTIDGFPVPSLDVVDYVVGSGSAAFGEVEPVVDLVNRTTTWTISNFPSETANQIVIFDLKTNESYTGIKDVSFDVTLSMVAGGTAVAQKVVNQVYSYIDLTPTPTRVPTASPTSTVLSPTSTPGGPTLTPTSTPTPGMVSTPAPIPTKKVAIEKVEVAEISQSTVGIRINTNQVPARLTISYGKSTSNLSSKVITLDRLIEHLVKIDSLETNADYFFWVTAEDENNNTYKSDIFTFKTAAESTGPSIIASTVLVISQDKVLYKPPSGLTSGDSALIIVPRGKEYTTEFKVSGQEKIKNVTVIIRESQVLGISTVYGLEPSEYAVDLVQIREGEYTGHLISPKKTGFYVVVAKIVDFKGNVVEQKIGTLVVIPPMMIYDKESKKPIEAAKVLLSIYNRQTNRYEVISPSSLAIPNPSYSEPNGEISMVLPESKYKAEISAEEYQNAEVEFTIGAGGDQNYPEVYLLAKPFSLWTRLKFYQATIADVTNFQKNTWTQLISSNRFYKLISEINLLITIILLCLTWRYKKQKISKKPALVIKTWLLMEALELGLGVLVILMVGLDSFFVLNHGWLTAGSWLGLGVINLVWWLVYTYERDKKMVIGK